MSDRQMAEIQLGRAAGLAYQHFKQVMDKKRADILAQLKTSARQSLQPGFTGTVDYCAGINAINAIDDMEKEILRQIKAGEPHEEQIANAK